MSSQVGPSTEAGTRPPERGGEGAPEPWPYADLYERAPVGYLTLDVDGLVLHANDTVQRMLGVARGALVGKPLSRFLAEGDKRILARHLIDVILRGQRSSCLLTVTPPDGLEPFDAYLESVPAAEPTGLASCRTALLCTVGHRSAAVEHAVRVRQERALREERDAARRRIDRVLAASAALTETLDLDAAIARAAEAPVPVLSAYCAVDLLDAEQHVRRVAFAREGGGGDLPLDPYAPRGSSRVVRTGEPEVMCGCSHAYLVGLAADPAALPRLRDAVGSYLCVPLRAHGRTIGAMTFAARRGHLFTQEVIGLCTEVARHAALAVDNARLYREAQEADQHKDEFLAMLGHELRNPLSAIVSAARRRLRDGDLEGAQRMAEVVERQGERLVRLVDDLLDVSRITRGKIALQRRRVALGDVIARAVESTRPLVEARRHALTVTQPDGPVVVHGDPARLEQVVVNLLANAAKYTEPGGRIALEVDASGHEAIVRVHDTGIGIPPDKLQVIFAPFTQLDANVDRADRADRGLGIGLALARTLVELHDGRITARSAGPGQGTELVMHLPQVAEEPPGEPAEEPGEPMPPPSAVSRRRVIVVEDNPDVAAMLQEELLLMGQEVRIADDGPSAIGEALDFNPELMLIDIGLPSMSGYELAEQLRREPALAGVTLVALTGYGGPDTTALCRAAGFDWHFTKPITEEALANLFAA
jgi:signal transduction histidine kinase/CheY-like chemotaxis protein/PAS domain-containing protein